MKATSIKQIKFNRGQVSDLLSERVDMGLQNACGTVYDNVYVNRYGQIQNAPTCILNSTVAARSGTGVLDMNCYIIGMFDTGEDYAMAIGLGGDKSLCVFGPFSKSNPYQGAVLNIPAAKVILTDDLGVLTDIKMYQFGYNVVLYGQNHKPILFNLLPDTLYGNGWVYPTLTVKENYFDGAFDNIYVRGLNQGAPSGFTVPTSGNYIIEGKQITTKLIATVKKGTANGSNFTQDLVGQMLIAPANGGVLQVRSVATDGLSLTGYIISPFVALASNSTDIEIPWESGNYTEWVFGYEKAYGDTAGPNSTPSYPDSVIYVNQRLVFGGNDYHGNLISASRIGIINDFDPESATESDAFTTSIASKDYCRIVDFVVSNNELRIACTNGEYAMSLSNLNPTSSLNGFDLRSEVGIAKNSAICDCGGLTAYTSKDRDSVYATQFSLLKDRYQPISLTSQTDGIVNNCEQLVYLTNRKNNEGNCLVGRNSDGGMFIGGLDVNAGLIGFTKLIKKTFKVNGHEWFIRNIFAVDGNLWGVLSKKGALWGLEDFMVRFAFGEIFDLPCWVTTAGTYQDTLTLYKQQKRFYDQDKFRALYYNSTANSYEIIASTGIIDNGDDSATITFDDDIIVKNIIVAGFPVQSDWRSVEIGVGMATREINKRIVKLEGVIEPTQITGWGKYAGLTLTPEQAKNFIKLTRSKEVETMDVDNLSNTSYTENADVVWRRAFDNPNRELHYGVSMVAPFLVKSLTCTVEYDEIQ